MTPLHPAPRASLVRRWDVPALEHVRHVRAGQEWVPHWHEEWSVGAIVAGECICSVGGELQRLRPGDCFAIAPGTVHTGALVPAGGAPVTVVMLYVAAASFGTLALPPPEGSRRAHDLALAFAADAIGGAASAQAWLGCALRRLAGAEPFGADDLQPTPPAQRVLLRLREAALAGETSVGALAARCGVSRELLHRVVRRWTGMSPGEYLRALRVNRARELVLGGEPTAEAAAACGFADQAHFTRWFRRMFGYTPGALVATPHRR